MLGRMSFDDGLDDDESGYRAPLPPDDRLWRHPSEVATRPPRHGFFEQRPWALALLSGLVGAMLASGLVVALGIDRRHPVTERVLERDTSGTTSDDAVVSVMERVRPAIVQGVAQHPDSALAGSGFLFRDDGYLLTDERLVAGATSLQVTLSDGRRLAGRPVGTDADTAVAVVKVDGSRFPIAPLGSDANLKLGQQAIAIGSPSGPSGTPWVSVGVVSGLGRRVARTGDPDLLDMIETDAPFARASGGGALLDRGGAVIGLTIAVSQDDATREGSGYATPIDIAHSVAEDLISKGHVAHAWLGVEGADVDAATATRDGVSSGASVRAVGTGSPARLAGLTPGDVVVAIDGAPVRSMATLVLLLRQHHVGDVITIAYVRGRQHRSARATLAERPRNL